MITQKRIERELEICKKQMQTSIEPITSLLKEKILILCWVLEICQECGGKLYIYNTKSSSESICDKCYEKESID